MSAAVHETSFMVKLKAREEVAERTLSLRLERPAGFIFKPGQYIDVTLPNPPETDAEGNVRTFSIASAPDESTLMIATRLRGSAFKRVVAVMPIDSEVKIEGPFGNLTMHNNAARPAVLLAGGIGITPFRSMVLRAAREKLGHRIFLFYSNRRPEDAPFLAELQALEKENRNYKFIGTMTEMSKSNRPWNGERELIKEALLSKYLKDTSDSVFYIAGPPAMVTGLQNVLIGMGVDEDNIRTEEFSGY
ncbi:MAG TPA: FAD-dependent oxidoreductase [Acidobacteriota bacterium]|nr:FAD-dependent oxidoreductase [Acidobacteriota bacterium]